MFEKKLNPYQERLFQWKGEEVIVEWTNPKRSPIRGKIVEVDIWKDNFMIETSVGEIWVQGGVRCITKIDPENHEKIPEVHPTTSRKQYKAIPEA